MITSFAQGLLTEIILDPILPRRMMFRMYSPWLLLQVMLKPLLSPGGLAVVYAVAIIVFAVLLWFWWERWKR